MSVPGIAPGPQSAPSSTPISGAFNGLRSGPAVISLSQQLGFPGVLHVQHFTRLTACGADCGVQPPSDGLLTALCVLGRRRALIDLLLGNDGGRGNAGKFLAREGEKSRRAGCRGKSVSDAGACTGICGSSSHTDTNPRFASRCCPTASDGAPQRSQTFKPHHSTLDHRCSKSSYPSRGQI